ncbi:uncharacterized protein LOC125244035 [Megalobrama amblycephala]|uniref:uncharacterized protein LOC125244035 n=1 Tax=Megalobrama amblycephala TaxID=75352 RepID=UPI0020145D80|nr:uncharacterized protein LOC125244035 [Megalobrama amblycephala]XP_048009909.1 uncharacterized protein LOC125244035 [Megalobrama amblycephala]
MDAFFSSQAPASPMPSTSMTAADRLIGLLQVGRSLERYVEEFVELAFLTNWPDAYLIALFLDGLDDNTIRFDEPDYRFSLNETINLILCLNDSKFLVEEVQDKYLSRPVPPETRLARPVSQPPSSSAYPSSEHLICSTLDPHSSAGSRKRRRRKKAALACHEPAALAHSVYASASHEPPSDAAWLIDFWTEPISPAAAEPLAPATPSQPLQLPLSQPLQPVTSPLQLQTLNFLSPRWSPALKLCSLPASLSHLLLFVSTLHLHLKPLRPELHL